MPAGYPRIGSAMFLWKLSSTQSSSASDFSNICCHVVRIVCKCVKYFFVKRKWCVPRFKFLRPLIEARHSVHFERGGLSNSRAFGVGG